MIFKYMQGFKRLFHMCPVKETEQPACLQNLSTVVSEVLPRRKPGLLWLSVCQIPENTTPLPTRLVRQTKPKSRMHQNIFALTCIKMKFLLPGIVSQEAQL